jgi:hypothetical protein
LRSKPQSFLEIVRRHDDAVAPKIRLLMDAVPNLFIKITFAFSWKRNKCVSAIGLRLACE